MQKLISASLGSARAVILIFVIILAVGVSSYLSIPKESEPDVKVAIIYVSMTHDGISPEDAVRLLVKPMEKELRQIENVKEMRSTASSGHASVMLKFNAGFDSEIAMQDVREKVDIVKSKLPEDTREPTVSEVNLGQFPVLNIILTGDIPEKTLIKIADNLKNKIEEIPAVLSVNIAGDREDVVDIVIKPETLESYGLTSDLIGAITRNNQLIAAGAIETGSGNFAVKVPGLLESLSDIQDFPLITTKDAVVTLEQLGTVKRSYKDRTSFARVNGKSAVVLEVKKRTGENIINTVAIIRQLIDDQRIAYQWPDSLEIIYSQDKSEQIVDMLNELQNNIIFATLLVMIVIIMFSGIEAGLFVALAIPGSFLIGILVLDFLGFTMNIVVLFSLILSIGMLVDAAIVIVEHASRKLIDGFDHKSAFADAAKRMAMPIFASTITTLIVFAPLLFWPGIPGQFMKYLPLTLIATLSGSFLMAIFFVPTIAAAIGRKPRGLTESEVQNVENMERGDLLKIKGFMGLYIKFLNKILDMPFIFVGFILLGLVGVIIAFVNLSAGMEFFPKIEPENAQIVVRTRGNLSIYEKDKILREVEQRVLDMQDEVAVFYTRSGSTSGNKGPGSLPEDAIGSITIEFADWNKRRKAQEVIDDILSRTKDIPGIIVEVQKEQAGPGSGKPIYVEVSSLTQENKIEDEALRIMNKISSIKDVRDVESTLPIPAIEWEMDVDRALALQFNIDMITIGNFIRLVTNGLKVTTYRPDDNDDEVDILLRFPKYERHIGMLDQLKVVTANGSIPLENFVERKAKPKTGVITRVDSLRVIDVKADVKAGIVANNKIDEIKKHLDAMKENPAINTRFRGDQEDQAETMQFLLKAFLLALVAMFLVLLMQFNNIYHASIIMSAVFLSTIGVLIGLMITGQPFGVVMCGVGTISLAGIVVNNNIILIDTYRTILKIENNVKTAIMRACAQRFKAVLLTAGTTVLGLLPMVIAMNIDFISREVTFGAPSTQWWRQLSTSIAGGLSFATILTLLLTPCLLVIEVRFKRSKDGGYSKNTL